MLEKAGRRENDAKARERIRMMIGLEKGRSLREVAEEMLREIRTAREPESIMCHIRSLTLPIWRTAMSVKTAARTRMEKGTMMK